MGSKYTTELLSNQHLVKEFSCGIEAFDTYIKRFANKDAKRDAAAVYVMHEEGNQSILGYYTLSAYILKLCDLPQEETKKLPKYKELPANLIGRLAIHSKFKGQHIGQKLLTDALLRAYQHRKDVAALAVLVDAKDKEIVGFYEKFGFKKMVGEPLKLYILMETIGSLYSGD
jgi:predicted GNAT family N-acyltransferase